MAAPYLVMFQLPWLEIVSTYLRWLLPYQLCHSGTHKYYYCQNILHIYNLPKHSTSNWMNTRCLFNASLKAKCYLIYISSNNLLNSAVFISLICWSQNVIKNEYLCNFYLPRSTTLSSVPGPSVWALRLLPSSDKWFTTHNKVFIWKASPFNRMWLII